MRYRVSLPETLSDGLTRTLVEFTTSDGSVFREELC